ncbi:DUF1798 family protein [Natribacillus halophilus]|uniref:DUF1798 family protein n=1 Tax=Natribacillus halophilus TaxID=549003 RepID=A0A1G8J9V3_9BACI|nr:DUF1798 family protein [Natribacillus halophilus]SDI27862.1 protein of unknown function [Natribacillus halophilus]
MEQDISALSERLRKDMEKANQYREAVDRGEKFSFHEEIVPFVDDVQGRAEVWRSNVQTFLSEHTLVVLHPNQVEHTYENMYVLATDSFHPHVQEQRYQERMQAVEYILNIVLEEIDTQ